MLSRRLVMATVCGAAAVAGCGRESAEGGASAPRVQEFKAEAERRLEQAAAAIDDATVTAKVKAALIAEPGLKGLAIDVDTRGNVVTLSGAVESAAMRDQAERVARRVDGVKQVTNNLTVKQPS